MDFYFKMELEALRSIYEGDECFKELSPISFQFRVCIMYLLLLLIYINTSHYIIFQIQCYFKCQKLLNIGPS